jgi:dihydrodipicolinate synthase/N-acetylneuraminate lyase
LQCGTTGESPTLSKEEKQKVIAEAIRLGKGRVQVVAGTGMCAQPALPHAPSIVRCTQRLALSATIAAATACPTLAHAAHAVLFGGAFAGSNNTAEAVALTQWAKDAGADACLLVNPYYNKPSQAGLAAHVRAVAEVGLPIILYNIPGRTGVNMTPQTVAECVAAVSCTSMCLSFA